MDLIPSCVVEDLFPVYEILSKLSKPGFTIHQVPEIPSYVWIIAASVAFYGAVYVFMKAILMVCWPHFRNSKRADRVEWLTRINSNINVIFTILGPASILLHEKSIWSSLIVVSETGKTMFAIFLGYIIIDLVAIIRTYSEMRNAWQITLHHCMGLWAGLFGMYYDTFLLVGLLYLLTELSTPFVNNHWFLSNLQMRNSLFFKLNGLAGAIVFFAVRICGQFYVASLLYQLRDDFVAMGPWLATFFLANYVAIVFLNTFWFTSMMKIIFSAGKRRPKAE
eukprot:TRINITY_DN5479_c0_g1_i1.p1 TRINITY_DN5479_c0_g1~~TRINITY_DN5479_c0_g1_i1.p1  ORF type:complete len:279 (-),score=56.38 TRINITY_DN5479_c0_g1_i1:162-998(-)